MRALVHFWDPDYCRFSFGSKDLCPTMEEYGMLTEFPNNLYRISDLERFLEKNVVDLKWKMLEFELEKKSRSEKERLVA